MVTIDEPLDWTAFGIWLTRPLRRLEKAIIGLGENRLDEAIAILSDKAAWLPELAELRRLR